jgi:signal transduction histidine kinase
VLGVLVAALPAATIVVWLTRDTPYQWILVVACLMALGLGLAIVVRAQRPLTELAARARRMAGLSSKRRRSLGLVRRDAPRDELFAAALDQIGNSLAEIRALNRIGQLVTSDASLEAILTAIVEEAVALLRADAGIIGNWDPEKEVFRDVAACNLPIMFPGREFRSSESFSSQVAQSGQVLFLEDYGIYLYRVPELERFRFRATLGAPLMVDDQSRGALVVLTVDPKRRFSPREGELLSAFASQAGAAFEKARLYQLSREQLSELLRARTELARESQELEQALAAMVRVQEEERSRIAADVHDGVVQMMVGSLCELQAAMAHFPDAPEMVDAKQQRTRELIRDSITELRRVIFDLRPITLDAAGLVPAVETLVDDLQKVYDARLELQVGGTPCRFVSQVEIGAYRIIQEAVNNALRHANAGSIAIGIRFANGTLEIEVLDDGVGFSVEEATSIYGKHAGLVGMRERARSLGGRLSVVSVVGEGTTVSAEIPCQPRTRFGRGALHGVDRSRDGFTGDDKQRI